MKKTFLTLAIALLAGSMAFAQKPSQGTFTTEVNFIPFSIQETPISITGLKGRYFINDNLAARLTLGFGFNTEKNHAFTTPGTTPEVEQTTTSKFNTFNIAPGIEYHFGNWEKTSLYCGLELSFGMNKASEKIENANFISGTTVEIKGQNANGDRSASTFGVNLFTGVDYYITESLYMGAEFGLGFHSSKQKEVETTVAGTTVTEKDYGQNSGFGVIFNPAIRLGWKF